MYENDTYEFCFNSGNKIARVEIGQEGELTLTDVLRAVQDILVAGGFTYVDEVRAVNYGERKNKMYSSNPEDAIWEEDIEIPVPGNRSLAGRFCRFIGRRTRALRDGTFFGTRRRNTAVVPRGTVMGDYMRRHYGLNTGGPLDLSLIHISEPTRRM